MYKSFGNWDDPAPFWEKFPNNTVFLHSPLMWSYSYNIGPMSPGFVDKKWYIHGNGDAGNGNGTWFQGDLRVT